MLPDRVSNPGPLITSQVPYRLRGGGWVVRWSWGNCQCRRGGGGSAMVLSKLPVPGRPIILITVGQGPIALAVGAGGGGLEFLLSSVLSPLSPSLSETARYTLKYRLKRPLNPNQPTNPVPGHPTIRVIVGQGPVALAVCAGGGCLDTFSLLYPFFPFSRRRPDVD